MAAGVGAGDASPMEVEPGANNAPPSELPALKVTFYELLIRQLQDDGFASEAQSISQQLRVEPNARVERDALFEAYGKSLKYALGGEPQQNWTPIECTPVPPLGAQEHTLDFAQALDASAETGQQAAGSAAGRKAAPEVRLLYTATHKQACRAVAFSADGRQVATGCADGSIKILDSGRMRLCAGAENGPLGRVRITEEELSKPIVRTLQDHNLGITCLAFHPMNPTLFSGSIDKAVKIFDLTRPPGHKKAFSVLQDVHPVRCLSIHPCGDFLLVGTANQAIRLYDLQTLNCFTTFHQDSHHSAGVNDLRCTSDGRVFASASSDGSIHLWDAVTHRIINKFPKAHSGSSVTSLRFSRGLKYLLSSGADGRSRLWDLRGGSEVFNMGFGARNADYSTAVFCGGERYVAAANSNTNSGDVSVYDAQTGTPVYLKLDVHKKGVHALEASPVDRTLMTGCDDNTARYFSVENPAL